MNAAVLTILAARVNICTTLTRALTAPRERAPMARLDAPAGAAQRVLAAEKASSRPMQALAAVATAQGELSQVSTQRSARHVAKASTAEALPARARAAPRADISPTLAPTPQATASHAVRESFLTLRQQPASRRHHVIGTVSNPAARAARALPPPPSAGRPRWP